MAGTPRRPTRAARALSFVALAALSCPGLAQVGGPLPGPLPLFPPDNWWNVEVSAAPVEPRSDEILRFIGLDRRAHPDFGGDADDFPEIYGLVYVSVPGNQPLEPVTFVEYPDESDAGAPGRPAGYPIPVEARSQPKWVEGGFPGDAEVDGDRHLLVVDRDHRLLFELYHARWNAVLGRWEAGSGAAFALDSNARRPEGWTSADAAGLAILPGLVRYDEAYGAAPIRHAFRVTVHATDGHVFPASHEAGATAGAPPLGTRLRLRAGFDLGGYPGPVRKIFQAMKTYGLIVADNGSDLFVQGTYDPRWDNDLLNPAFASLRAGDFEVVQLGWRPSTPPPPTPGACVEDGETLCLASSGRFRVRVNWRTAQGTEGTGHAVPLTPDTGAFWFFDPANLELIVKVLDACGINGRFWVFAAGLTDVATEITVADSRGDQVHVFESPLGTPFQPVQDTRSFAGCP